MMSKIVVSSVSGAAVVVVVVVVVVVIFGSKGMISHRLPLKPVGHSHLNSPSSAVIDVHLPPFEHVFAFTSQ